MNSFNRSKLIELSISFLLCVLLIDGVLPQLQILLFSGSIINEKFIKIFLLFFMILFILNNKFKVARDKKIYAIFFAFVVHSIASILFVSFSSNLTAKYIFSGFMLNSYYYFIFPVSNTISVNFKFIKNLLLIASIPIIGLGFVQYLTNLPILSVDTPNKSFNVTSWEFYGDVRAFSFFTSPLNYGYFLSFILAFFLHILLNSQKKIDILTAIIGVFMILLAVLSTQTRNIYFQVVFEFIFFAFLFLKNKMKFISNKFLLFLPFIFGAVQFLLIFVLGPISILVSQVFEGSILKDETLVMRLNQWINATILIRSLPLFQMLFGVGLFQGDGYPNTNDMWMNRALSISDADGLLIDNSFLNIILYSGFIGLFIWLLCMITIWKRLYQVYLNNPMNTILFSSVIFWSTWISSSILNISSSIFPLIAIISMSTKYAIFSTESKVLTQVTEGDSSRKL